MKFININYSLETEKSFWFNIIQFLKIVPFLEKFKLYPKFNINKDKVNYDLIGDILILNYSPIKHELPKKNDCQNTM